MLELAQDNVPRHHLLSHKARRTSNPANTSAKSLFMANTRKVWTKRLVIRTRAPQAQVKQRPRRFNRRGRKKSPAIPSWVSVFQSRPGRKKQSGRGATPRSAAVPSHSHVQPQNRNAGLRHGSNQKKNPSGPRKAPEGYRSLGRCALLGRASHAAHQHLGLR